jgi:hypothetical protein
MKRRVVDESWVEESYCPLSRIPSHPPDFEVIPFPSHLFVPADSSTIGDVQMFET